MNDRRDPADNDESLAEEAEESSEEGWEKYAEHSKESDKGGESAFPDVDVLAHSLESLSDELSGQTEDDEESGGAPGVAP